MIVNPALLPADEDSEAEWECGLAVRREAARAALRAIAAIGGQDAHAALAERSFTDPAAASEQAAAGRLVRHMFCHIMHSTCAYS